MAKDNRTFLYVGIGCGALALMGMCIATAAVGWLVYRKGRPQPVPVAAQGGAAAVPSGFRQVAGQGFTFSVPQNWIDAPVPPPVLVGERAPMPIGNAFTNVNVVNQAFLGDNDTFTRANVAQLQLGGSTVVGQRPATVGTLTATDVESVLSTTMPPTKMIQRYTTSNGMGWVMTCTGPNAEFESVRPQCMQILDTFRIGN